MKADSRYIPFLDGFRGFAILFVIIGHINRELLRGAQLGVTLFFFVSGFLITKLLIFEYNKKNTISLRQFYLRRVFRLYPALIFFLIITCIFIVASGKLIIYQDIFAGLFYFTNYYLIYFKPIVTTGYPLVSEILWSLSVEEHFYLFFPFLFILLFNKNKRLLYTLAALLIFFLFVRCIEFIRGDMLRHFNRAIYYTTHSRADSILYGCFSAVLIYWHHSNIYIKALKSNVVFIVSIILLLCAEVIPFPFFENTLKYSFQGIAFSIIVPSFLFMNEKGFLRKLLDGKVIVYIGKLSYSLYLFHWIAIYIVDFYYPKKDILHLFMIIILSVSLSLISFYGVERPFISLRRRFGSNAK